MINTIPLRPNRDSGSKLGGTKKSPVRPRKAANHEHVAPTAARTQKKPKFQFRLWHGLVLIVLIAAIGIVAIRLSRAADADLNSVPLTEDQLRGFVGKQLEEQIQAARQATGTNAVPTSLDQGLQQIVGNPTPSVAARQISGIVGLQYNPSGVSTMAKAAYYLDGNLYAVSTKPPYQIAFDSTRLSNGNHTIIAVAYDKDNQAVTAIKVPIEINNNLTILRRLNNVVTYPWYQLTK